MLAHGGLLGFLSCDSAMLKNKFNLPALSIFILKVCQSDGFIQTYTVPFMKHSAFIYNQTWACVMEQFGLPCCLVQLLCRVHAIVEKTVEWFEEFGHRSLCCREMYIEDLVSNQRDLLGLCRLISHQHWPQKAHEARVVSVVRMNLINMPDSPHCWVAL